ncbi:MAG: MerR family transcriptional regulator [Nitrospiraceae bacterium]
MKNLSAFTIGSLAKAAGVGLETVRFYERKGLISRPVRPTKAYREYSPAHVKEIRFIKRAQDLGFSLKEIQELLNLNGSSRATCTDIRLKVDHKLKEIEMKLHDLKRMKRTLQKVSHACGVSKQAVSQCPVTECFDDDWQC